MRIDYHDLSDRDFEDLVVCICTEILGTGAVPFATGPDGKRDVRFEGTALDLPNSRAPYTGKFIGQAKHTENPIAKFSDRDFSGPAASSVLSKELPGVRRLVENGELDNYLLFSNRSMGGLTEQPLRDRIRSETGVQVVELFGIERINLLLRKYPSIQRTFGSQPLHLPLLVTCDDLAEVIASISQLTDTFESAFQLDELERLSFEQKNLINGLSEAFARFIMEKFLPDFASVKQFLANPANDELLERYLAAADSFQEQIIVHRGSYQEFDHVLLKIMKLLFFRDTDLSRRKYLTKLVVYYMYWNCDIGSQVNDDVAP